MRKTIIPAAEGDRDMREGAGFVGFGGDLIKDQTAGFIDGDTTLDEHLTLCLHLFKRETAVRSLQTILLCISLSPSNVVAQDYIAGLAAFNSRDYATAQKEWTPLAEQGDAEAQYMLVTLFGGVEGILRDNETAREWLMLSAAQGFPPAQYELGNRHNYGFGASKDHVEAVRWYRLAAEQNYAPAELALGQMYEAGQGVTQDSAVAAKWVLLAALQGNANAQTSIGVMYFDGIGITADASKGLEWLRLAAAQGNAVAQTNLGLRFENGWGVPKDVVLAHMWYSLAALNTLGSMSSPLSLRDAIASVMTPDDLAMARERARTCLASNYSDCG